MPNLTLRQMTDQDLLAIYQQIKHVGPAGAEAPKALPPGHLPEDPLVVFPSPPHASK